jgi:hypothetical protein
VGGLHGRRQQVLAPDPVDRDEGDLVLTVTAAAADA